MIACDCDVCRSDDPHDRRTRTSALLTIDGHNVLIDATPELRIQCLANDITSLASVLITHTHADHIMGMDDIRRFNQVQRQPINIYASPAHVVSLEKIFGYARADRAAGNCDLPQLIFNPVSSRFSLFGQSIIPLPLTHGPGLSLGYRVGPLAYCTDVSAMSDEVIAQLANVDVLVLGAPRPKPHRTHLCFEQAIDLAGQIGASSTYFVHLTHDVSHRCHSRTLPPDIYLAHDGLKLSL